MSKQDKFISDIVNGFQKNKGNGSVYCFVKEIIPKIVTSILKPFFNKSPNKTVLIVVDCYATRVIVIEELIKNNLYDNKKGNIKILSKDYVTNRYHYPYDLVIISGINDDYNTIAKLTYDSTFTLAILTKNIMDNQFITSVRNILPSIKTSISNTDVQSANVYSPVEENRRAVIMSDNDLEAYNKYTEYINESVNIFGDIANIEKCKRGDIKLGISAAEFRDTLAKENGWSPELDTTIDYIKKVDDVYNPNILYERACNFYTIAKQRRDLVSDNNSKLDAILEICMANENRNILIVSKRGEYAAKVTKYLVEHGIKCGDYHDCIDDKILIDNEGNPVLYKTGAKKGSPRIVGSQAQSSLSEKAFKEGVINVLSIKCSSNTKLKIACDIVIFTSPLCDNIIDLKKRFVHVRFNIIPTITYMIYCKDSIEHDKLIKEKGNNIIKVIDENEDNITYDEFSGDIIL